MRMRTTILLGAAALVGSTLAASAQSSGDSDRYGGGPAGSSPSEMQQTNDLNQQAVNGTYQSPGALNGQQSAQNAPASEQPGGTQGPYAPQQMQYTQPPNRYPNSSEDDTNQSQRPYYPSQTQYSGPPSQYDAQQQQYQGQMQQYRDQQDRYRYDRDRYMRNLRDYDIAQYEWSYPAPYVYHYGTGNGLRQLYLIAEPSQQLSQAPVEGPGGRWVGRVRNVEIGPDGRPFRVEVALNRRVSVWVSPGDLRFDPAEGILYTDLSRGELWSMPGATIESAPL